MTSADHDMKSVVVTFIYSFIHSFQGSISLSQRQWDVEQVKNTQTYTIFTMS